MNFTETKMINHAGQTISTLTLYSCNGEIYQQEVYNLANIETFGFYQADKRDMLKKAGEMTYEKLQQLEELKKAEVIETKYEGTCQLWEVVGHEDKYVVLVDNSVMTQREDNDSDEVIFPF